MTYYQVEDASALHEFDSILTAADGIVLSRGNLGLDVAPEKMARVQKCVISACNLLGGSYHMRHALRYAAHPHVPLLPTAPDTRDTPVVCSIGRAWKHADISKQQSHICKHENTRCGTLFSS
jgi:Pyruvate kinase, barrel domain